MTTCDECEEVAQQVWRQREYDGPPSRTVRWLCLDCHPELPAELTLELPTDSEDSERLEGTGSLRPDGGTMMRTASSVAGTPDSTRTPGRLACPVCSGETYNAQGIRDCRACGWAG